MKYSILLVLGSFVALPSIALAQEPAKGTLIMVSSVGLWVVGSSLLMLRKGSKQSRGQEDADKQQNTDSSV
jgi:hypothetical protein